MSGALISLVRAPCRFHTQTAAVAFFWSPTILRAGPVRGPRTSYVRTLASVLRGKNTLGRRPRAGAGAGLDMPGPPPLLLRAGSFFAFAGGDS
jgi:hypothetical protein